MTINEKIQLFRERLLEEELRNYERMLDDGAIEVEALRMQGQVVKRLVKQMNNYELDYFSNDEL